jgi:hypothetical protein
MFEKVGQSWKEFIARAIGRGTSTLINVFGSTIDSKKVDRFAAHGSSGKDGDSGRTLAHLQPDGDVSPHLDSGAQLASFPQKAEYPRSTASEKSSFL